LPLMPPSRGLASASIPSPMSSVTVSSVIRDTLIILVY